MTYETATGSPLMGEKGIEPGKQKGNSGQSQVPVGGAGGREGGEPRNSTALHLPSAGLPRREIMRSSRTGCLWQA